MTLLWLPQDKHWFDEESKKKNKPHESSMRIKGHQHHLQDGLLYYHYLHSVEASIIACECVCVCVYVNMPMCSGFIDVSNSNLVKIILPLGHLKALIMKGHFEHDRTCRSQPVRLF